MAHIIALVCDITKTIHDGSVLTFHLTHYKKNSGTPKQSIDTECFFNNISASTLEKESKGDSDEEYEPEQEEGYYLSTSYIKNVKITRWQLLSILTQPELNHERQMTYELGDDIIHTFVKRFKGVAFRSEYGMTIRIDIEERILGIELYGGYGHPSGYIMKSF